MSDSEFPRVSRPSFSSPSARRNRNIFLGVSAISTAAILIGASEVLLPFVLGLVVAFLSLPIVLWVEKKRVPRWAAILIVYAVGLGIVSGFVSAIVPSLITEAKLLRTEVPDRIRGAIPVIDAKIRNLTGAPPDPPSEEQPLATDDEASQELQAEPTVLMRKLPDGSFALSVGEHVQVRRVGEDVYRVEQVEKETTMSTQRLLDKAFERGAKYVSENTGEVVKLGQKIVGAVWRGVFTLFMTLMLGGYMMLTHEAILQFFRELFAPESQPRFDRFLHRLERGLAGVVRGQLLICMVNGVLSAIGFWLFDLKYWPIMSLVAAIGSLIPIFGSILATIPAVAIGLTQSPGTAFAVLAWVIGIHQLEANFLNPKIIGDAAKIHPVLVVFSLLVGEHFFQIKGALFAVPVMSIVQTIFLHFRETTMGIADPTATMTPSPVGSPPPPKADPEPPA
jgi:predicted PurR-regulated permease PerM